MKVSSYAEIQDEFIARAHKMVWCSVATVDTCNRVRSRILHPIWEGSAGWAGVRRQSLKAKHIAHNPYVSLAYISDIVHPVYADCKAEWEESLEMKRHVWELFRSAPPPLGYDPEAIFAGPETPDFGLLKFTPWRIELFDAANMENRKVWRAE